MKNKTKKFAHGLMLIPFLTTGSPLAMFTTNFAFLSNKAQQSEQSSIDAMHAKKIDDYFAKRDMPLEGYGARLVKVALDNDLDWRLLPAIAIAESTGGKFACNNNPFGWGSCKIKFKDFDSAIETVAMNLGGNNPKTEQYYKDATTTEILHHYNNSVVPTYTAKVVAFMELIEKGA
jgi:hypothetical protein